MKLRVLQSIENENYVFIFSIDPSSISSDDMALFTKYGPQSIDFGGTFTDNASVTFTLPDIYYDLPTSFPVQQVFSATGSSPFASNTANRLQVYRTAIENNITTAITTLRTMSDTFTGEFIVNI